jgi:hypothetical protein
MLQGIVKEREKNFATFLSFKESGKWYASGRAHLTPDFFRYFGEDRRGFILGSMPDGNYPGLSGPGSEFVWVIVPDDDHENGFPLMLRPEET